MRVNCSPPQCKKTPTRSNPTNLCVTYPHNVALYLLKRKKERKKNECKIFLGVFSMFILIHPETYFIYCIAPPLHCGGTPTMSNCTCFYSHNVAILRAHTHTHTHTHTHEAMQIRTQVRFHTWAMGDDLCLKR